jgi:arsenate reductase-like glutaredoxin family protein
MDIEHFIEVFKLDLVNKRSTTWRQLSDAQQALSIKELINFAPSVMKRPIIDNGTLFLGWNTEIKQALGLIK